MPDRIDLTTPFHNTIDVEVDTRELEQGVVRMEPRSDGPPLHVHAGQDEWWEVLEGELEVETPAGRRRLGPGATLTLPRGSAHTYRNPGDATCVFRYRLSPGYRFHEMLRTFEGLAKEGRLRSTSDLRSLLHLALVFTAFEDHVRSASPPHAVMRVLAWVGGWLGARLPAPA